MRAIAISGLLVVSVFAACRGQTLAKDGSASDIDGRWMQAKATYFSEINKSLQDIFNQLDVLETNIRNSGDVQKLRTLNEIRSAFVERGEISPTLKRDTYDTLRRKALEAFASSKKALVTESLQNKQDSIAEFIDEEFSELSDPLTADVQARWASAAETYATEVESARLCP